MEQRIKEITAALGYESLNEMQRTACEGNTPDRVLLSATGSGKTVAFLLPAIIACDRNPKERVLIIAPSRELSFQIENVFRDTKSGYAITCCYGGHSVGVEERSLEYAPRFIVGTPGRLLDHLRKGNINPKSITRIIFDEFDKLLELGFSEEISEIVSLLSQVTARWMTSATDCAEYPDFIIDFWPEKLDFLTGKPSGDLSLQRIIADPARKTEQLFDLLCGFGNEPAIVFCNHRQRAETVSDFLYDRYLENEFFHGGMEQFDRERALAKFRNGSCNILLSTGLAARGLDIPEVKHIVHYQSPPTFEEFVHRNGRTARMSASGSAYVFDDGEESPQYLSRIETTYEIPRFDGYPPTPAYRTIYFGMGKKDKINKVDLVGFLCQKANLEKSDIGLIEVKDFHSFVAVRQELAKDTVKAVWNEKIKNKRTKIAISK